LLEAGGASGAPGDTPDAGSNVAGAPSTATTAGAAGAPVDDPNYGGPRQAGGCKCHMGRPSAGALASEPLLALVLCGVAHARRRRRSANAG